MAVPKMLRCLIKKKILKSFLALNHSSIHWNMNRFSFIPKENGCCFPFSGFTGTHIGPLLSRKTKLPRSASIYSCSKLGFFNSGGVTIVKYLLFWKRTRTKKEIEISYRQKKHIKEQKNQFGSKHFILITPNLFLFQLLL